MSGKQVPRKRARYRSSDDDISGVKVLLRMAIAPAP